MFGKVRFSKWIGGKNQLSSECEATSVSSSIRGQVLSCKEKNQILYTNTTTRGMDGIDGYRPDAVYLPQCMSHSKTFEQGSLVFNIFGRMVLNLLFLTGISQV